MDATRYIKDILFSFLFLFLCFFFFDSTVCVMENNDKYVTLLPTIVDKRKLLMGGNIWLML